MGRMLSLAVLVVLLTAAGPCSASRQLQQNDAAAPAAAAPALTVEDPAATAVSNIQLNAPGTSNLLNAPALAPASGPLPAGVVSLQVKNGGDYAEQEARMNEQLTKDETTPGTRKPVRGRLPSPSQKSALSASCTSGIVRPSLDLARELDKSCAPAVT